ncbi:MAG TPA: sugar transferase [Candidatus Limousia pullorum]|uniref:Sugar transferase n=1 Tax=Candidatus Limousia pullorum TaxID=2840860 RepID=A0A9D1LXJ4_9FIRM|nr:sugar transferase [Anaeromassilibacillus sp. An172]MEE0761854.1 sugar transferase [Acutalibacteraceae bacterium]OUP79507.1 glycosyl transferase [Anaeromassilibacillus sp. An172]HIU49904.1 sugar transferase [Candidatus Limousia pullorum]
MKKWDKLPDVMKTDEVKPYYLALKRKTASLIIKRVFDIIVSLILLILLSPVFLVISIMIKTDSKGPVMFRQVRVTQYGKTFRIFKFRTMVTDAEKLGTQVTVDNDSRITKTGNRLRKCRLDEIPQLLNILKGEMSFVGTRPEVEKYVNCYTPEMMATLLLPAGVTSTASIAYKDEDRLLKDAVSPDDVYVKQILPEKMKYNLEYLKNFGFFYDIRVMIRTVTAVAE